MRRGSRRCTWLLLAAVGGCATLSGEEARRLQVFDTYWQALADGYPYFGQKHVDWIALRAQYRSAAVYARRPDEFYHLLTGMLAQLADPHVSLSVPAGNWREGGVDATSLDDVAGFARFVLEGRIYVASWPAGAEPTPPGHLPPEAQATPEIIGIEGVPVVWPLVENLLLGAPGSAVELALRWSDGTLSRHVLHRPQTPPPPLIVKSGAVTFEFHRHAKSTSTPSAVAKLGQLGRWAVLRVDTFSLERLHDTTEAQYTQHLDALMDEAMSSDGLILDLRSNGGGNYSITQAFAGRFLRAPYTQVLSEQQESRFFGLLTYNLFRHSEWRSRPPVFAKPVVVLSSWHTGSAAEHLARLLQTECGAIVVGERTIGAEAAVREIAGDDGSTMSFGGERLLDSRGRGLQGEGILPDVPVRLRLEDVQRLGSFAAARADWEERVLRAARAVLEK